MADITVKAPDIELKVGARIQPLMYYSDSPLIADRDVYDFRLRRARFSLVGAMEPGIRVVFQTETAEEPGSASADTRIIDAFLHLNSNQHLQLFAGQFLAPGLRQNVTSAGSLLTMDRPGIVYKSLSWGTRALTRFSSLTMSNTDVGLRGDVDVRDLGLMLFGSNSEQRQLNYKYYLAVMEGAKTAKTERILLRAQLNWGDAESGQYHNASYLGDKNTVAVGFNVDQQSKVAFDSESGEDVDYLLSTIDLFVEKPVGAFFYNLEAAWIFLDLDDAAQLADYRTGAALSENAATNAQGQGYYVQSALTVARRWQPWLAFEAWHSDAEDKAGSYDALRLGLTYFINGQKANVKLGYELTKAKHAFSTVNGNDESLATVALGFFITF